MILSEKKPKPCYHNAFFYLLIFEQYLCVIIIFCDIKDRKNIIIYL